MGYKINGVVRIATSGDANLGIITATTVDAAVSKKVITEVTAGDETDITGADELLLYDNATDNLLRVSVDELIVGAGIGTLVSEFDKITVGTGTITADEFYGDGHNLTGIHTVFVDNQNINRLYLVFTGGTTGEQKPKVAQAIRYQPSTGTFESPQIGVSTITIPDGGEIVLGDSSDFSMHHDGDHTYFDESGQGNLKIRTNNFRVSNVAESKTSLVAQVTTGVELYYNGGKKLETASSGVQITGITTSTSYELASGPTWTSGTGSPEGAVTAPVGSLYSRTDGGANTSLYVKETGTGNTGWAAK